MRSRTSLKNSAKNTGVEEPTLKDQPHLTGAYIRSLVKHLSSSRTKDPSNLNSGDGKFEDKSPQYLVKPHEIQKEIQQRQSKKKQARRRFHTSRPYQERLLNMAEARREIVAALKLHRASIKKASEQKKQLLSRKELLSSQTISSPAEGSQLEDGFKTEIGTTGIPLNHFSNTCSFPASFASDLSLYNSASPVSVTDFNIVFPKPPLGLNLNISSFENLWPTVTCRSTSSPSLHLTSSSSTTTTMTTTSTVSSSSSQTCSSCMTISVPEVPLFKPVGVSEATSEPRVDPFHLTIDDKEMEEIRFIGEQHDMEWNDKLNSVHSAWWCKFLKTVDNDYQLPEVTEGDSFGQVVDEIGIPPWLSDQECLYSCSSNGERFKNDANLPCPDLGEIEGLYGEWLL